MKNNRLLSFILGLTLIFTSLFSAFPTYNAWASTIELYDEDYQNALSVITAICPEFPLSEGEAATRAEFATAVAMMLGNKESSNTETGFSDVPSNHKYSGNIKFAKDFGLISSADNFYPDTPITYMQAIKILMCATGHGKKAEYIGGYPSGYLMVANETNVGKNFTLSVNATLTHQEATKLIFDAVCTDMLSTAAYGDKVEYTETEGKNILSVFHKIYIAEGVADGNKDSGLYAVSENLDSEGISINGDKYYGEGYSSLLGKKARVYFTQNTKYEIIYAYPIDNKICAFTHDDDLKISGTALDVYLSKTEKEEKYSLENDYTVIYNGKYFAAAENTYNTSINPDAGSVEIIDNNGNGKFDVIIIKDIEYGVVGSVNTVEEKIYDKFKMNGMRNLSVDVDYYISDSDGEPLKLSDLEENDVVGYACSKDGKSVEIIRYTAKTGGTYNELSGNVINLGKDRNVELSKYFIDNIKPLSELKMGTQIIAYLGLGNQVVYMEEFSTSVIYGFLVDFAEVGSGLNSKPCARIYSSEGDMLDLNLADSIVYNGSRISASVAKTNLEALKLQPHTMRVVKFAVNAQGELSKLYSAVENTDGLATVLSNSSIESRPVVFDDNTNHGSSTYSGTLYFLSGTFFPYFSMSTECSIMQVPLSADNKDDMDYYKIHTSSSFSEWTESNSKNVACYGYDVTQNGASFILWTAEASGSSSVGDSTPTGIVESITTGVDEEGNIVKVINMYRSGSWKKLYSPSTYKADQSGLKTQIESLKPGDMARVSFDKNNTITALQIDFSYINSKKVYTSTNTGVSGYGGKIVGYAAGYVYSVANNTAIVVKNKTIDEIENETLSGTLSVGTSYPVNLASGTTVFVEFKKDRQTNEILSAEVYKEANTKGVESYFTAGKDADYIVSRSRFHEISLNVIYVN